MHPQPMNRGIEIASDVADGPQSVIREQVRNGVAVRMAVLEAVIEGRGNARPAPRGSRPQRRRASRASRQHLSRGRRRSSRRRAGPASSSCCASRRRSARRAPLPAASCISPAIPTCPMRRPLSIMRVNRQRGLDRDALQDRGAGTARPEPAPRRRRDQRAGPDRPAVPAGSATTARLAGRRRRRHSADGVPRRVDDRATGQALEAAGAHGIGDSVSRSRRRPSTILVPGMPAGSIACDAAARWLGRAQPARIEGRLSRAATTASSRSSRTSG